VAWNYFGSARAKDAIRKKVEMLFPKHEWEHFTEHFFAEVQQWRETDAPQRADQARARAGAAQQHTLIPAGGSPPPRRRPPRAARSPASSALPRPARCDARGRR
jgi:hypothetical protein